MTAPDDRDLFDSFAALRSVDAQRAPSFEAPRRRPPAPAPSPWLAAATLAAAAVVTAVIIVRSPGRTAPPLDEAIAQARALSSWTAPTDTLLTVSDLSIPSSLPSLAPASVALPATTSVPADTGDSR